MRLSWGRVAVAVVAVGAAAALAWSLVPRPVPVETAKAARAKFVATVDEDGKTRVRERYVVVAPLAGRSARVRFKVGDAVAVDDPITSIGPSPVPMLDARTRREYEERLGAAEAARESARAFGERARAQAAQARTDLERVQTLVKTGAATAQALERAELAMRVADRDQRAAEFQDHATEHDLGQARALVARYAGGDQTPAEAWTVTAPVGGVVLKVNQESETIVTPGTPLVEIGDAHDLEIVVDVLSTDAVEIKPGAAVAIERWGGPGNLAGRVRRVEPAAFTKISTLGVEEQRVNVVIDITSPAEAWQGLGDGYRVEARIAVFTRDDPIVIPTGALFRSGPQWQVFVVDNGRAERRDVDVLRRSGSLAAIAGGLSPGEEVIVYPGDRVAAGVAVRRL